MHRPAYGDQLLTQHAGRAGEQEEKAPPTRSCHLTKQTETAAGSRIPEGKGTGHE